MIQTTFQTFFPFLITMLRSSGYSNKLVALRNSFLFDFQALQVLPRNMRSALSPELESSIFRNIRNVLRVSSFFFELGKLLPEIYVFLGYPFPETWRIFSGLHFLNYNNSFLLRKSKKFLYIWARKFHFAKYMESF